MSVISNAFNFSTEFIIPMKVLHCVAAATVALTVMAGASQAATIFTGELPTDKYVTINNQDWTWASPCAPNGCSVIDMTEQSQYGWHIASKADLTSVIAYLGGLGNFVNTLSSACASGWFNATYSHCDLSDAKAGNIWNLGLVQNSFYFETFALRTTPVVEPEPVDPLPAVPVPAAGFLLAGALAGTTLLRRTRRKAA